jgi:hypothetical protein
MRKVKSPAKPASKDVHFGHLIYQATKAANDAGDVWIDSHTKPVWNVIDDFTGERVGQLLDVCGFAYVQVKDKRTAFAKWLKTVQTSWDGGYNSVVRINSKYDRRQELGLKEVCAEAAYKVLTDAGIKGLEVYSRID